MSGRYLIQSGVSFQFIHVDARGDVGWTPSLAAALRSGVVTDPEEVQQLVEDHFDKGTALIVDLDAD